MDNSLKLLLDRTNDLFTRCGRRCEAVFSDFLDGGEIERIKRNMNFPAGYNVKFFGGYDGAERRILGVFPEWEEPGNFPISVLVIKSKQQTELNHRDYLGTLLSQGIDRSKIGDICVSGSEAYAAVREEIASYLCTNTVKVRNQGVKTEIKGADEVEFPKPRTELINTVCASRRLDAAVGAVCGISRAKSARLISGGMVKLNHIECTDVSKNVSDNDLLSVRGSGRFIFRRVDGETGKGRLHISIEKFV